MRDPSAAIIAHYERHATAWDADRRRLAWGERAWHGRFAGLLPAGAAVLDLGCGGAIPVAAGLIAHGVRVTGVDTSPTLLGLARARFPAETWIAGDMRTLALARSFDGILAWDSFFHLSPPDQRRMFAVFAAHATPGSLLMLNTGPAHGVSMGSYRGDPLYHASLDAAEYRWLLARHGYAVLDHRVEAADAGGRTVWLAVAAQGSG
ncbi:MAG: class I SAM-dependent methyltransferase [Hyphomicrobiaceae bacterium]|nr:class I SAM-dependent methyltransferase [Hyphomicrobiaceae bacterium]